MQSIILSQTPSRQTNVVQQRLITSEEENPTEPGQVSKPAPSFVYFILAILLVAVALWAITKFKTSDVPTTLVKKPVKSFDSSTKGVNK